MIAPIRQIDWRRELAAFAPYLAERCGIAQFKFASEDCAPNHFSALLKQAFVDRQANSLRFSVRVDHDFASTHTPADILDEFEVQLTRLGIEVEDGYLTADLEILTGNEVGRDMDVSIGSIHQHYGTHPGRNALGKRVDAARKALDNFIAGGGRFMIEFRDCPIAGQTAFWRDIWDPLLAGFEKKGMVFIHMLGPASQQRAHEGAPNPDWTKTLPTGFASDEARQNDAYDDLFDVFKAEGQSDELASARASTLLDPNLDSVSQLHSSLAAVLMSLKTRSGGGS